MKFETFIISIILVSIFINSIECNRERSYENKHLQVKLGVDILLQEKLDIISGKKVGLITNATGVTSDLRSIIDALYEAPAVQLVALFGPEHGVRGDIEGGHHVPYYIDEKTEIPVYSLYGATRRPTPEMLKDVEVLIYDIQDIGSRAYTYIYTMAFAMEEAKEANIPFVVLDRPNPLSGNRVEGNMLDPKFSSFIGLYPIPQVYGMTVGELAKLFNNEFNIKCNLIVIPMKNWRRDMLYDNTGLTWIPTSPHVPHAETAFFVAATGCIGELGTVSEGVGYTSPFEIVGAPWIKGDDLARELNSRNLPGVFFRPMYFKPFYMKFIQEQCSGIQIHILDKNLFSPSIVQIHILTALHKLYPDYNIFDSNRVDSFDKACGTDQIRKEVMRGSSAEQIISHWAKDLDKFNTIRHKYLIYN